ncbi:MAG: cbb3-type cytochrome c oxidase subunit II [Acidimicrobiia bacterium]
MSDALRAAASALGAAEALVQRSAEARAQATGTSVDEVLAAWAGGEAPPPGALDPASTAVPGAPSPTQVEKPATTAAVVTTAAPAAPAPSESGRAVSQPDYAPPLLVGDQERVGGLAAGVVGLLLLSILLAVVMPGIPEPGNGVRTSNFAYSQAAREGRQVFLDQGCGSCHTQMVRNVVSDFGLGPVTLSDTNQVIGYRRYGPDLAAAGSRISDPVALMSVLTGMGHPVASTLGDDELANLTAYLLESR